MEDTIDHVEAVGGGMSRVLTASAGAQPEPAAPAELLVATDRARTVTATNHRLRRVLIDSAARHSGDAVRRIAAIQFVLYAACAGLLGVLSLLTVSSSPAGAADVALLCPPGPNSHSSPATGITGVSVRTSWDLEGGLRGSNSVTPTAIDVNGDLVTDAVIGVEAVTGWLPAGTTTRNGRVFTIWDSVAISRMRANSHIDEVGAARLGIDYADFQRVESPLAELPEQFRQLYLHVTLHRQPALGTLPAGTITLQVTVGRASGQQDSYTLVLDTTGSTGAPTPWPDTTTAGMFLDFGQFANFTGVALRSAAGGQIAPWSNLTLGADVQRVEGTPVVLQASAGFTGPLARSNGQVTSAGSPGDAAFAVRADCGATSAGTSVGAGYDRTPAGAPNPVTPRTLVAHLDSVAADGGNSSRTYADVSMGSPPEHFGVAMSATGESVDVDPSNGQPEAFADGSVRFGRTADTTPSLAGVFVSQPQSEADPTYVAIDAEQLPGNITVETESTLSLVEDGADADGLPDIASDLTAVDARLCAGEFGTPECDATLETSGAVRFTLRNRVPAEVDGLIPAEFDALGATPAELIATQGTHFVPATVDTPFVRHAASADGSRSTSGRITGLQHAALDLTGDPKLTVDTEGLGLFAGELVQPTTRVWASMADVPDHVETTVDLSDDDGDPLALAWTTSSRTGAAVFLDQRTADAEARRTRLAGWIGTGSGTTDGLPTTASITAELDDPTTLHAEASGTMHAELGVTTNTAADRNAGMRTMITVTADLTEALDVFLRKDADNNLERVDLTTCSTTAECGPITGLTIRAARTSGAADEPALTGVTLPAVPDADAFPAFATHPNRVHAVLRESAADPALTTFGVDVAIDRLDVLSFLQEPFAPPPPGLPVDVTNICVSAATADTIGVGLYRDRGPGTGALYADATLDHTATTRDVNLQAQFTTIQDDAEATSKAVADRTQPLLILRRSACPDHADHTSDPAPNTGTLDTNDIRVSGTIRRGSAESVRRVRTLASPKIAIPANGLVAATYSAEFDTGESFSGADAALSIPLPGQFSVKHPAIGRCGGGGNLPASCSTTQRYNTTTSENLAFSMSSDLTDLGPLDLQILTDRPDTPATDALTTRTHVHLDRIPAGLDAAVLLAQRPRDGVVDVNATLKDTTGANLPDILIEISDDYEPARLGDPSENLPGDQRVPNLQAVLDDLGSSVSVDAEIYGPTYGRKFPPFDANDCKYEATTASDENIFPFGDDFTRWPGFAPRSPDDLRPGYVHVDVDMNRSAVLTARVASTTDGHQASDEGGSSTFDKGYLTSNRIVLQTSAKSSGVVHALVPGVTAFLDTGKLGFNAEICLDADIPLKLSWTSLSSYSLGIDLLRGTVTIKDSERLVGGVASIDFVERIRAVRGGFATPRAGIYVHGLRSHFNSLIGKDFYTRLDTTRKDIGMIDLEDPTKAGKPPVLQNHLDTALMLDDAKWEGNVKFVNIDDVAAWFAFDPVFHKNVEQVMLGATWNTLWGVAVDKVTRPLPNSEFNPFTFPTLIDAPRSDAAVRFETREVVNGEVAQEFGPFGRLSDGTRFKLASLINDAGRIQLYLVAEYSNGQVRYVRQVLDETHNTFLSEDWVYHVSLRSNAAGRTALGVNVAFNDGTSVTSVTAVFDPSGNGGQLVAQQDLTAKVQPHRTVVLSGGLSTSFVCRWYPGDGTVHETAGTVTTFTYQYDFPGTYAPMRVCYQDDTAHVDEEPFKVVRFQHVPGPGRTIAVS